MILPRYGRGWYRPTRVVGIRFCLSDERASLIACLEKDAVRQLITTAISGLEESGRIQPTALLGDSAKATQVTMDTLGSLMSNKYY